MDVITRKADGTPHSSTDGSEAVNLIQSENPADIRERNTRYHTVAITATHPGNDTTAFTFLQVENAREYRLFPIGTDGDLLKVVEDAVNGTQALAWVSDETSSLTGNKQWWPASVNEHSEWKELTKGTDYPSLSRLDFEVYTGGANVTAIIVETR